MKGIIVCCALALQANSQFNFQINGAGLRVGILGSQIVNIGGGNKDRPFTNSLDLNVPDPKIPLPNINIPSPFAPFSAMQLTPEVKIQSRPSSIQPPKPQVPKTQVNTKATQNSVQTIKSQIVNSDQKKLSGSKQSDASQLVQKVVESVLQLDQKKREKNQSINTNQSEQSKQTQQESIKEEIKYEAMKEPKAPVFRDTQNGKVVIIDVTGQKQKEKQDQSEQIKQLKRKQDQRLAKFVHLMPESEKKHLRAIATQRIPN